MSGGIFVGHTRRYKKQNNTIFSRSAKGIGSIFASMGRGIAKLFKSGNQKLTIMVVPHTYGKVFNIRTNAFAIIVGIVVIAGVVLTFVPFSKRSSGSGGEISRLHEENKETLASLDELRDENNALLQVAKRFQSSLNQTLSLLGINQNENISKTTSNNSDLASLFDTQDLASGALKETADINQLMTYLESSVQPVEQIGKMLSSQKELFNDIPSIWPIKNGIGHVSFPFGQNINPMTGLWYIHKGIDLSTYRSGDGIVATANGQVAATGYDAKGYGNYVIIKHNHGIYTRYAHMSTIRVQKGDQVSQGDVIGTIGNTGNSTGPHLHYEVHIGSDVVDPAQYINIK